MAAVEGLSSGVEKCSVSWDCDSFRRKRKTVLWYNGDEASFFEGVRYLLRQCVGELRPTLYQFPGFSKLSRRKSAQGMWREDVWTVAG